MKFFLLSLASIVALQQSEAINVVPQPAVFKTTGNSVYLATPFKCSTMSSSQIVANACERYMSEIIFRQRAEGTAKNGAPNVLEIMIDSDSEDTLQFGMNENYTLATGMTNQLLAPTVWGALRGLETFAQLVQYDFDVGLYTVPSMMINDYPRFPYRGLMTDLSRHWQSPRSIRRLIDSMSAAKYNTLHMHLSDDQSFAVEVKAYPKLWSAAWSKQERWSSNDLVDIVDFAKSRGVRVMFEFDMPGHASSWCKGYPEVCPAPDCKGPLDPTSNTTWDLIDKLIGEYSTYFFDNWIHLGGDEVNTGCYSSVPHIAAWLKKNNYSANDGYKYFVKRAHDIGHNIHGKTVVQWNEVFDNFGTQLARDTIVHCWYWHDVLRKIVAAGYKVVLSDSDFWYFDHLQTTWQQMYMNEPFTNITDPKQQSLILGGELCMWGETVDPSDIEQTIWPRAAAGAERLWSPINVNSTSAAKPRMEVFRCKLMQRGIAAAPLDNQNARQSPPGPGSCSYQ